MTASQPWLDWSSSKIRYIMRNHYLFRFNDCILYYLALYWSSTGRVEARPLWMSAIVQLFSWHIKESFFRGAVTSSKKCRNNTTSFTSSSFRNPFALFLETLFVWSSVLVIFKIWYKQRLLVRCNSYSSE